MVEALTMSVLAIGRSPPLAVLQLTHARVRSGLNDMQHGHRLGSGAVPDRIHAG